MTFTTPDPVLSASSDAVFFCDRKGVVFWHNASFKRVFPGIALGSCLEELFDRRGASRILSTGHYRSFEIDLAAPVGTLRQTALVVACGSGEPDDESFMVTLFSAPPENRELKAREEILATFAHDLKNPVGAIFGYADVLIDTPAGDKMAPQHREIVCRIRRTAARVIELVKNYQFMSSASGRILRARQGDSADLNSVVSAVIDTTWREEGNSPVLQLSLSRVPVSAAISNVQLERIVANLFGNALKFSPIDATIIIRTAVQGKIAILEVANSAPLIPEHEIPRLFDRNMRGESAREIPGSGLGLFIVKSIVDSVHGHVSAESSAEKGTVFRVELPLHSPAGQ